MVRRCSSSRKPWSTVVSMRPSWECCWWVSILGMGSANERRYNVTLSLIGWAHTQNAPWNNAGSLQGCDISHSASSGDTSLHKKSICSLAWWAIKWPLVSSLVKSNYQYIFPESEMSLFQFILVDFSHLSLRVTSMALGQASSCVSAGETTLKDMGELITGFRKSW